MRPASRPSSTRPSTAPPEYIAQVEAEAARNRILFGWTKPFLKAEPGALFPVPNALGWAAIGLVGLLVYRSLRK